MRYVALLRGINVGGNKKISMDKLKELFEKLGYSHVTTMLNTGNVIFDSDSGESLIKDIGEGILEQFGFSVALQIRDLAELKTIVSDSPFHTMVPSKDTHWYVTFFNSVDQKIPIADASSGYRFLAIKHAALYSVVYRNNAKSTDFMSFLDKHFGREVTTRNWNTIQKIVRSG